MGRRVVRLRAGCCSGIDCHVEKARASETTRADEVAVAHNYGPVTDIITERVAKTEGRISAKRLLPVVQAAGYSGSARNLRRAVAEAKARWRIDHHLGRRPGVWAPGDMLVFDTGGRSVPCSCSAPCWPGAGSASCTSPTTFEPRRPWPRSPSAWRRSAACRRHMQTSAADARRGIRRAVGSGAPAHTPMGAVARHRYGDRHRRPLRPTPCPRRARESHLRPSTISSVASADSGREGQLVLGDWPPFTDNANAPGSRTRAPPTWKRPSPTR